ncbi:MAG: M28 family peptidase [bacterium]
MNNNQFSNFLNNLVSISPRRGLNENLAAKLIHDYLSKIGVKFILQEFKVKIPVTKSAELFVDNLSIPCLGASFSSGEISKDTKVLNAFGAKSENSMIIFNPISEGICLQSYKETPSVAISRDNVVKIVMGNKISGKVEVEELEFTSQNILVGNILNPESIVFAHYDSLVGQGAVDNAAAVDVIMQTITNHPDLISNNLFVFIGSEEESITSHDGLYGFEVFDQKYSNIINSSKEILVLDGVGISSPKFVNDHIDWVFGISRIEKVQNKVIWMQNDQSLVMKYYHSDLDTLENLDPKYTDQAVALLKSRLN